MIIHADGVQNGEKARIETFVVGHKVENGEKLQWAVEGGKYKASFLLPDVEGNSTSEGLLISEVSKNFLFSHFKNFNHHLLVPGANIYF